MKVCLGKRKMVKNITIISLIMILIGIFAFTLVSCGGAVRGSGNLITEERDVSGFNKVSVSGSGNLYIEQGEEEALTIEAEDNILPLIITRVSGSTLKIGFRTMTSITTTKGINYYLKVKDLKEILGSGSGSINCEALKTEDLYIDISGSRIVDMSNLVLTNIDVNSSGSGNITVKGTTDTQNIETSGSTKYYAEDLVSESCTIDSSGSGELIVNVSDELDINASGSVNITYIGSPSIDQNISGSASISSK